MVPFPRICWGDMMSKRLGDYDAQAVDLLLDRSNKAADGNGGGTNAASAFMAPVGDEVANRIGAVESVLRLVTEMPAPDPAPDLIKRTLERIHQRGGADYKTATHGTQ